MRKSALNFSIRDPNEGDSRERDLMMKASDTILLNNRSTIPVPTTRMGFGCAPLGNLFRRIADEDALATLQAAYDAGIRYFDTAPQYGLGVSEGRLGKGVGQFGRDTVQISTKVGRLLVDCAPEDAPRRTSWGSLDSLTATR